MQTKPFKVVREVATMDRYADYWAGVILFLSRISTDADYLLLYEELLGSNLIIRRHLRRTLEAVE